MSRPMPPRPSKADRRIRKATNPYAVHARRPAGTKLSRAAIDKRITLRAPKSGE